MHGPQDWEFLGQDELGKYEDLIFSITHKYSIIEDVDGIELGENGATIRIPVSTPFGRITYGALYDLMKIDAFWGIEAIKRKGLYLYFDSNKILK
jgi:hypothetical protein